MLWQNVLDLLCQNLSRKSAIEYYKNTDQEVLQYHMQYLNKTILQ